MSLATRYFGTILITVFILVSCRPPFHTEVPEIVIPEDVDITRFVYQTPSVSGMIKYKTAGNASVEVSATEADVSFYKDTLWITLFFGNSGLDIAIPVSLGENSCYTNFSTYEDSSLFMLSSSFDGTDDGYSAGIMVEDNYTVSIYPAEDYSIDEIRFSISKPIDLSFFDTRGVELLDAEISIDMESLYYLIKDLASQLSFEELRFYNNHSLLESINHQYNSDVFASPATGLPQLVDAIVAAAPDEGERLLLISDWISDNIYYDYDEYYDIISTGRGDLLAMRGPLPRSESRARATLDDYYCEILQTRRAVCGGYASLLEEMALRAGLSAPYVVGWASLKNQGSELADYRHAWNAVQINGEYYFLDTTWNGAGKYREGVYTDGFYSRNWTLVPADVFVLSHWPEDDIYQMLDDPVSESEFVQNYRYANGSYIDENFFKLGYSFEGTVKFNFSQNDFPVSLKLNHPAGKEISTSRSAEYKVEKSLVSETSSLIKVNPAVADPSLFSMTLWSLEPVSETTKNGQFMGRIYFNAF